MNAKPPLKQMQCCLCFIASSKKRKKNFQRWMGCFVIQYIVSYNALNLHAMCQREQLCRKFRQHLYWCKNRVFQNTHPSPRWQWCKEHIRTGTPIFHLSFPITKPRGLSLLHWYSKFCPRISKHLLLTSSDGWTEVPKMKSALRDDLSREEQGLPGFVFPLYMC